MGIEQTDKRCIVSLLRDEFLVLGKIGSWKHRGLEIEREVMLNPLPMSYFGPTRLYYLQLLVTFVCTLTRPYYLQLLVTFVCTLTRPYYLQLLVTFVCTLTRPYFLQLLVTFVCTLTRPYYLQLLVTFVCTLTRPYYLQLLVTFVCTLTWKCKWVYGYWYLWKQTLNSDVSVLKPWTFLSTHLKPKLYDTHWIASTH